MSSDSVHVFLFSSLDSKNPLTSRKVHIRRLYDILQLSLQRNDFLRAKRAWAILSRCKEMNWKSMWTTGLELLGEGVDSACTPRRLDYLRNMMLQHPDEVGTSHWFPTYPHLRSFSVKRSYKSSYFTSFSPESVGMLSMSLNCKLWEAFIGL